MQAKYSVIHNGHMEAKQPWYWRLRASNGEMVSRNENFGSARDALRSIAASIRATYEALTQGNRPAPGLCTFVEIRMPLGSTGETCVFPWDPQWLPNPRVRTLKQVSSPRKAPKPRAKQPRTRKRARAR